MRPACQRLEAEQAAVAQRDLRLIEQLQRFLLQGEAQIGFQGQSRACLLRHLRRAEARDAATLRLGLMQRSIRIALQGFRVLGVARVESDADARTGDDAVSVQHDRAADGLDDALRKQVHRRQLSAAGDQDVELIAANARDGVTIGQHRA